ncbi:helix-turn-helix transcriptional regulator [Leptospira perolatii]|uniref:helix-turn-helix transcriptional regulator n=1 Tax=Leptospira perolatii TaxID=2023191 RepID=UPI003C6D3E76
MKTPLTEVRVIGEIPEKLLDVLKEEFGKKVKIEKDNPVSFRKGEFFQKNKKLFTPGNHMKTYRSMAGFTQTELGKRIGGIPRSHISAMESGSRSIGKETAKKLAELFGVSVEMFL